MAKSTSAPEPEAAEVNPYTVLQPLELAHCPEGEHMASGVCEKCSGSGMVPAGDGLFAVCSTCNGTRGGGPELGPTRCEHPRGQYGPGQTVHLSDDQAEELVEAGMVAPQGAENLDELLVRAAAVRLGLTVSGGGL